MGHHGASSDHGAPPDGNARKNHRATANRDAMRNLCRLHSPVIGPQQAAVARSARSAVIGKQHAVTDEHFIGYGDPGTNKGVQGYLAQTTDDYIALNFDKRADGRTGTYGATIEINQLRMVDHHARRETNVVGNRHAVTIRSTRRPPASAHQQESQQHADATADGNPRTERHRLRGDAPKERCVRVDVQILSAGKHLEGRAAGIAIPYYNSAGADSVFQCNGLFEPRCKRLDGKVPLAESVEIYERGEALKRRCDELLKAAEARVDKITTGADGKAKGTTPLRCEVSPLAFPIKSFHSRESGNPVFRTLGPRFRGNDGETLDASGARDLLLLVNNQRLEIGDALDRLFLFPRPEEFRPCDPCPSSACRRSR